MRWSQLKSRIESRFIDDARGRVEIFETLYRHDYAYRIGEFWITLDKVRIFSSGEPSAYKVICEHERNIQSDEIARSDSYGQAVDRAEREGHFWTASINKSLFASLSMSIDDMFSSPNPVLRGLALIDSRFGVRRLNKLEQEYINDEHEFVEAMLNFRTSMQRKVGRDEIPPA